MYNKSNSRFGGYRCGAMDDVGCYVETDPSRRYGRFREVLGKGAVKTVYKAFDEVVGMEVAWNQVKLNEVFRSPEALQRLYSEVHLLKNLSHDSIIQYHTSWIDVGRRTFNFITEMFTSGTLREYRNKYRRVDIRAIKRWARQILNGLAYLHGRDPPVIHRDLKCDNIFVNGHLGQVKIGDLGLAAILRGSQHAHSVIGTPEFMAPELYEEEYNELVDVYSFGMCVLEMLTGEYPYSECSNPAQIYKKVTSGKLPEAFYKIQDAEAQCFVGKCLETVSKRSPAKELLLDSFLATNEGDLLPISRIPPIQNLAPNGTVVEHLPDLVADPTKTTDMSITGMMNSEEDTIFLKVQISDKDGGHVRNIHFPFNIVDDTSIDVALEMVKELEIIDWEPLEIAEMIEEEISSLIPNWKEQSSAHAFHHQHSFNYEDDDDYDGDIRIHHPFYSNSSCSSSQASLPVLHDTQLHRGNSAALDHNLNQENPTSSGDSSSNCSLNSLKYSNINYYSSNEDDTDSTPRGGGKGGGESASSTTNAHGTTRFCPEANTNPYKCDPGLKQPKLTKIRSLVDMRTQVLHRSLMELINKRRMFKTVGSVENMNECHDPSGFLEKVSLGGGALRGRSRRS